MPSDSTQATPALTAVQGQAWDMLAKERFGHETGMGALLEANPDACDALLLAGGTPVRVPDTPPATFARTLPPWEKLA